MATTDGKSHLANCGNGRKNPVSACDKLRQIRCRLLSPFAADHDGAFSALLTVRGWCPSKNYFHDGLFQCRFMVGVNVCNCRRRWLPHTMSTHPLVAVCANRKFNYVSPVVASMYCSPHPAPLHIAPAARLRSFASMDSRAGLFSCKFIKPRGFREYVDNANRELFMLSSLCFIADLRYLHTLGGFLGWTTFVLPCRLNCPA
jgi:hypothetical protein